jgi:hypothetical protein
MRKSKGRDHTMNEEQDRTAREADKQAPTQPPPDDDDGVVRETDEESTTPGPKTDPEDQEDGRTPPPDDLSKDPAYEPEDEGLKGIKGG